MIFSLKLVSSVRYHHHAKFALHNIFRLANQQTPADFQDRSCVGTTVSTIESTIFWLELFWTPSLVIAGYLLLPRPGD